ncbi:hypothetical protein R3P38DRAFT_3048649 [Favolaschia claudopus]|uniref:F-box domain-containing protein n=1 Tax=Favolaschia claudopus TaxID=2862362 RepID=A0AAW0A524_9AGAR
MPIASQLWKRNCSYKFLYESLPAFDVSNYDPSTAPIQKLPVELLGEIFLCSLSDWGAMTDELSRLPVEPLVISQVCGHWRAVSLSIPMIWSTLWIDRPRAAHVGMVKLWLERSRSFPLSIHLRQTDPKSCLAYPTSMEHQATDEIFTLLIPHLARWRAVDLDLKMDTQQSLLCMPAETAVALENIALNVDSWDCVGAEFLQNALYSRPSVRSVHLSASCNPNHVAWEMLTSLEAQFECTLETCLSLFALSPALTSARFICSAQPDWPIMPFTHAEKYLTLPSLANLSIKASHIDLAPLFDRLVLPALRTLALEYCHVPRATSDHQSLHALLDRSSCVLEAFSLYESARTRADDHRPIAFLQTPLLTSVKELELKVDMTDEIVGFLTLSADSVALPNLTALALVDCRGDHISDDALLRMLLSRIAPPEPSLPRLRSTELRLHLASHEPDFVLPVEEGRFELMNCVC